MTFENALGRTAAAVNGLLGPLLAPESRVLEAMRYASLDAGKRLRPFFVVESARLFGVAEERSLRTAAALECVHCYSLVHDDLPAMDNDDLRRGRPAVHRAFDEATAILAGDGLLTFAFEILAGPETHDDPAVRAELVAGLAKAAGARGMVGGQMLDLLAETHGGQTMDEIIAIQSLKTGALFRFACAAGAMLGRADGGPLTRYADRVGLAFQIADDVLDVESTAAQLGKATQKDKGKGKATFVDLLGLDGAKAKARGLVDEAVDELAAYGARASLLADAARFVLARRS